MKRFLRKTLIISLPIIVVTGLVELFITYYPNTFNTKANYLNSHLDKIEILFLGSSHTQNGINPEFIDTPSANVAYSGQDYLIDNAIFFQYIDQLRNLNKIVIEMDYLSLEEKNEPDYFRLPWYYKYYDVNLGNFKALDNFLLFLTNPSFFKKYLLKTLNPFDQKMIFNEYGFIENDTELFEK